MELEILCSVGLALDCCDVFWRLPLGIPSLSFKVAHYRRRLALALDVARGLRLPVAILL
jgi:hypothetical protein